MIPIQLQPEPDYFDAEIRQKGKNSQNLSALWTKCLPDLYQRYQGICAYYGFYIEYCDGSVTVDHFKPKSRYPNLAYEWNNYRLACLSANRLKRNYEDILDPLTLKEDIFYINFSNGEIFINKNSSEQLKLQAETTISRLKLNEHKLCRKRINDLNFYLSGTFEEQYLRKINPFVYLEAKRQNLI